ncbi:MAG: SdrD B-like domain-containing protein [Spirosomataceae bacterium]
MIVTNGVCIDSITVNAPTCDKTRGQHWRFHLKDVNDNGLQDLPAEKGVSGVKLNLYAAAAGTKTGPVLQTKTTDVNGAYLFTGLPAGSYIVEIDKTSLPDTCAITPKKDVGANASDASDSDFDPTSGLSQVVTLNPVFNPTTPAEILATNNLTVDAGLVKVCVKPNAGPDQTLACSANGAPSTANLVDAAAGQKWKVLTVQPNTTVTVTTPQDW